ncbi:MAG: hypothetical protein K6E32_03610 [Lachnospiraceae bacterium]|nr:hypothetical protein [Lachnospiraceae bacterium]
MKKRILAILLCAVMVFTLTACDSPVKFRLMNENSDADISWEAAAEKSPVLKNLPKLTNNIDVIEYTSSSSAVIHLSDEDYEKSLENYVKLLKDYGYSFIRSSQNKDKYDLKFYLETGDEPIAIIIKGYELKYEKTKNIYISIIKSKYNSPF